MFLITTIVEELGVGGGGDISYFPLGSYLRYHTYFSKQARAVAKRGFPTSLHFFHHPRKPKTNENANKRTLSTSQL